MGSAFSRSAPQIGNQLHPYEYSTLSQSRQIRLAEIDVVAGQNTQSEGAALLLKNNQDILRVKLKTVSLDDLQSRYLAISYVCGDPAKTRKVLSGDNSFIPLTEAAAAFLENMATDLPGCFWMDALCIDQINDDEKARQIRLMSDIFTSAQMTVGWLGPSGPERTIPVDFIHHLQRKWHASLQQRRLVEVRDILDSPGEPTYPGGWNALAVFLENPFFQRVWIVQEIVLSSQFYLTDGKNLIAWDSIAEVAMMLGSGGLTALLTGQSQGRVDMRSESLNGIITSQMIRLGRRKGSTPSMTSCIIQCQHLRAVDPRDKVFALLGMASDGFDPAFEPRYGDCTPEEVYTSATRRILTKQPPDATLLYGAGIGYPRSLSSLQSWVPDLSSLERVSNFGPLAKTARYRASGDQSNFCITCDTVSNWIKIRGSIVDRSAKLAPLLPINTFPEGEAGNRLQAAAILAWLENLRELVPHTHFYPTGSEFYLAVLARTLIANNFLSGAPTPFQCQESFNDWLELSQMTAEGRLKEWNAMNLDVGTRKADNYWNYGKAFTTATMGRRFFGTVRGSLGLGPQGIQEGDELSIFQGMVTPFLIRKREEGGYRLVGECYVDGLMDGEGLRMGQEQDILLY